MGNNSQDSVALRPVNSVRRNTSTDNDFLEENLQSRVRTWTWPPRLPSQEPDDDDLLFINSFDFDIDPFEEEDLTMSMDEQIYAQKLRVVRLAELRVKDVRDQFLAANVQRFHLSVYETRLKEIRDEHKLYIQAVNDLVIDLDTENDVDQARVSVLNKAKQDLSASVSSNEDAVLTKIDGFQMQGSQQNQQALDPRGSRIQKEKAAGSRASSVSSSTKKKKKRKSPAKPKLKTKLGGGDNHNIKCTICGSGFKFPSDLNRHYSAVHYKRELADEYGKNFCKKCNLDFIGLSQAAAHFGQKHGHVKKYLEEDACIKPCWTVTNRKKKKATIGGEEETIDVVDETDDEE